MTWKKIWDVLLCFWLLPVTIIILVLDAPAQEDHEYTRKFFDSIAVKQPTIESYPTILHLHLSRDTVQTVFRFDDGYVRCYYIFPAYDNRSPVLSCTLKDH